MLMSVRPCAASVVGLRRESARFGRANAIDHSVKAITSARVLCRHTARRGGNSRAEVMIIATSGAKAPETPARTVIGWFPPPSALRRGADGSVTILPPSGWAICDGTKGTSDLSNRFIIDCLRSEKIGSSSAATHNERVKLDPPESIVTLIYIMKL